MYLMHFNNYNLEKLRWAIIVVGFTLVALDSLTGWVVRAEDIEMIDANEWEEPADQFKVANLFNYEQYLDRYHKLSLSSLWSRKRTSVKLLVRTKLFIARTLTIFKHNALYVTHSVNYYLKQNEFTDMPTQSIKERFVSDKMEMSPVSEASSMPDMPADECMARLEADPMDIDEEEDQQDELYEDFSQASLADLEAISKASQMKSNARLDFFTDPTAVGGLSGRFDLENLIKSIISEPALARQTLEISSQGWMSPDSRSVEENGRNAEMSRRIARSPIVKPNNPHFDASLLPSQGIFSKLTSFIGRGIVDEDDTKEDYDNFRLEDYSDSKSYVHSIVGKIGGFLQAFSLEPKADHDNIGNDAKEQIAGSRQKANGAGKIFYDVDWRVTGCVPRAKNQMECNACYIFAVLDMMEFNYCQQKRVRTEFSPQYMLDCGRKTNLGGCKSGKLADVGRFIMTYGIQLDSLYPYQAREDQCPFDESEDRDKKSFPLKPQISAWQRFDTIKAWYQWYSRTPVVVGINMPSDFLAYGGGIHEGQDCVPGMVHAMILVGSGHQDGHPFWLLKNSFSDEWGESGYFRLSKRAKLNCFNSALILRANFSVTVA